MPSVSISYPRHRSPRRLFSHVTACLHWLFLWRRLVFLDLESLTVVPDPANDYALQAEMLETWPCLQVLAIHLPPNITQAHFLEAPLHQHGGSHVPRLHIFAWHVADARGDNARSQDPIPTDTIVSLKFLPALSRSTLCVYRIAFALG